MVAGRCGYGPTLRLTFAPLGRGGHCCAAGQESNLVGLPGSVKECGAFGRLCDDEMDEGGCEADGLSCEAGWLDVALEPGLCHESKLLGDEWMGWVGRLVATTPNGLSLIAASIHVHAPKELSKAAAVGRAFRLFVGQVLHTRTYVPNLHPSPHPLSTQHMTSPANNIPPKTPSWTVVFG